MAHDEPGAGAQEAPLGRDVLHRPVGEHDLCALLRTVEHPRQCVEIAGLFRFEGHDIGIVGRTVERGCEAGPERCAGAAVLLELQDLQR